MADSSLSIARALSVIDRKSVVRDKPFPPDEVREGGKEGGRERERVEQEVIDYLTRWIALMVAIALT